MSSEVKMYSGKSHREQQLMSSEVKMYSGKAHRKQQTAEL